MEILFQALRQLTSEVASLKQAQKTNASKPQKKGPCWKDIFREIVPPPVWETSNALLQSKRAVSGPNR